VDAASDLGVPTGVRELDPLHFVAFARLRSSLRYEVPFLLHRAPLRFGSAATEVRAYGLPKDVAGETADRMREQVDLHVPAGAPEGESTSHVVVVLKARDGERVVLSGRPARETLAATWLDARRVLESTPAETFSMVDGLAIPRVSIRAGRSYDEIAPAPHPSLGGRLVLARQDVSLTVDERGADVDAEAVLASRGGLPRIVRYDGPFLVALLAPGREEPYVVAWIGNHAALDRSDRPIGRPPDAAALRAIEGTWHLNARESLKAMVAHWRRQSPERGEWIDQAARDLERHFAVRSLRLVIRSDASVLVVSTQRDHGERAVDGYLASDGPRLHLVHPSTEKPRDADEGHTTEETRWTITFDRGRMVLHAQPAGEILVLVR
jgi:hypothetical protein